jgi:hypothetical protein
VEICGKVLDMSSGWLGGEIRACSACAGEYEDPDRTAWTAVGGVEHDEAAATCEEIEADDFPFGE